MLRRNVSGSRCIRIDCTSIGWLGPGGSGMVTTSEVRWDGGQRRGRAVGPSRGRRRVPSVAVTAPEHRTELPVLAEPVLACTLGAGDQADRVARWRQLARAGLRDADTAAGRLRLRYELSPAEQDELRELAAGERSCCGFARFDVTTAGRDAVLEVTGPDGTELFFDFMADRS